MMMMRRMCIMRTKLTKIAHHHLPTPIGCGSHLVGDREARVCVELEYCWLTVVLTSPKCVTFIPIRVFLYICVPALLLLFDSCLLQFALLCVYCFR
ncbi:hypothetical protein EG68_05189 [Paragonimus skrjabini miyazakii]|uniref:Uncharacterized protein n=1 Tax=Paragonimus skrjabini miyazakii TaxID=59628 RepID=A0A8S9Z1D8_9TREM|nr:hypothetical protein EG68_05189 [Paragonimus skrjabini miyazakii]